MRGLWLVILLAGCGAAPPPPEDPSDEDDGPETFAVALRLEDAGATEDETPETRVALVRIAPDGTRTLEALGVESGACWNDAGQGEVLIAARCWWAGAGARYEVVREGDAVIARRQGVDEMADGGEWTEVGRVEIPEGARVQVLTAGRAVELPSD